MKFDRKSFNNAKEMFGVDIEELDDISIANNFEEKIKRDNRIGSFINFDSVGNDLSSTKELNRFRSYVIPQVESLLLCKLTKRERNAIIDAINIIALYSEMCYYSNIKKTYGIKVKLDKKDDDKYIGIRSIPLKNGKYRMSIEHGAISVIINGKNDIPLQLEYQIALDIFRGLPEFDTTDINLSIFDRMVNALDTIDYARPGLFCTRDILQFEDSNGAVVAFVPFDTVCVGINEDGHKKVVPYLIGILLNAKGDSPIVPKYKGYAIKVSNGDKINKPSFMEPCKGISFENNTELFLELINDESERENTSENVVLRSLRILATAMLSFNNAHEVDINHIYNAFMKFRFHDDYEYEENKNAIKIG